MDHLDKTDAKLDSISLRLGRIESEIEGLKVKSGVWGAIAGVIATLGVILATLLTKVI
jgi:hypothetical protein